GMSVPDAPSATPAKSAVPETRLSPPRGISTYFYRRIRGKAVGCGDDRRAPAPLRPGGPGGSPRPRFSARRPLDRAVVGAGAVGIGARRAALQHPGLRIPRASDPARRAGAGRAAALRSDAWRGLPDDRHGGS